MIYDAKCSECGKIVEYSRKIEDRDNTPKCCDKPMQRIQSPTRGYVDGKAAG